MIGCESEDEIAAGKDGMVYSQMRESGLSHDKEFEIYSKSDENLL